MKADQVWDLVVTMHDATGVHTSMFFYEQEGTKSSFHGIGQAIARYGLFASLYIDWGNPYFNTPEAGTKVDKVNLTEVGVRLSNRASGTLRPNRPRRATGASGRFRHTRDDYPKSWPAPGSLTGTALTAILRRSTTRGTTACSVCPAR